MTQCLTPLHIFDKKTRTTRIVPCGRCDACLVRQCKEWEYRLREELRNNADAYFITLTYSDEHLPIQEFIEEDSGAIFYDAVACKKDLDKFHHDFRRKLDAYDTKLRYYLISEYGPTTQRPHYHGIYFFSKPIDWDTVDRIARSCWPSPNISVSVVTEFRIKYVSEYCFTRQNLPDHLPKPLRLTSRRPGIGADYVSKLKDWHNQDPENRVYCPGYEGEKFNMPRYYREKIFPKPFLQERARQLEEQKFQEEYDRENSPDFDASKFYRDRYEQMKDYGKRVHRLYSKKSKKL